MKKEINKNLPNYLTIGRIVLTLIIITIMLFPFDMINVSFPKYLVNDSIIIDVKLVICSLLFVIASITDFFDGRLARKYNLVSDFGKIMDAIADKVLINGMLIVLCGQGYISPIIPVIIVIRDIVVNTIKMVAGEHGDVVGAIVTGKFKTAFLMIGITLKLIGNYPLGLFNIALDDFCLVTATILAVLSAFEYFKLYKKYFILN